MRVQVSDAEGVTERGGEGKGKRAGEMETWNLDGLAFYFIRNKISSNRTRETKDPALREKEARSGHLMTNASNR